MDWKYVKRDVESTLSDLLDSDFPQFIHVRGRRRVGKTTTVIETLQRLGKNFVVVVLPVEEALDQTALHRIVLKAIRESQIQYWKKLWILAEDSINFDDQDVIGLIKNCLERGVTVILEEAQRAGPQFRAELAALIDEFTRMKLCRREAAKGFGHLVFIGSLPSTMDSMLGNGHEALYQRISSHITITRFNSREMFRVFQNLGISSPLAMLAIKTATAGSPWALESWVNSKKGRSTPSSTSIAQNVRLSAQEVGDIEEEIVEEETVEEKKFRSGIYHSIFCSCIKAMATTDIAYSSIPEFGLKMSAILEALANLSKTDDGTVLEHLKNKYQWKPDEVKGAMKFLCHRYRLIDREYSMLAASTQGQSSSWIIIDPIYNLNRALQGYVTQREDHMLEITDEGYKQLDQYEGKILEDWLKEMVEERCQRGEAPLPLDEFFIGLGKINILRGGWSGFQDCEIDFVATAETNLPCMLFGSCKRNCVKQSLNNLVDHVVKFYKHSEKELCKVSVGNKGSSNQHCHLLVPSRQVILFMVSGNKKKASKVPCGDEVRKKLSDAGLELAFDTVYHFSLLNFL